MNGDCIYTIKKIARNIFKVNSDVIIKEWLRLVKEEALIEDEMEMIIIREGFEKLVHDFIEHLSVGDVDSYFKSNEEVASTIASNDISFEKFLDIFHLFEDSYLPQLEKLSNEDFRKYITTLDKLHHKTMSIISRKYFDIKEDLIFSLANLIELRDYETAEHIEKTSDYCVLIAKELGLEEKFINILHKGCKLHDIGKVGIKESILLKPGKLTAEEYEEIKRHTIIGANAIDKIIKHQNISRGYLTIARDIALYHHEKFDGSGYPMGLKGEEIPLCARILALVDAYDTITSKRSYKEAMLHEEALSRIVEDSGKHFDPMIVNAFLNIQNEFENQLHREY